MASPCLANSHSAAPCAEIGSSLHRRQTALQGRGAGGANRGPWGWVSPSPSPSPRAVEACIRYPWAVHGGLTTLCFLIPPKPSCNPSCSIGIEFTASREQGISNGPGARWRGNHDTARPLLPERGRGLTPLPCGGDSEDGGDEEGVGGGWEGGDAQGEVARAACRDRRAGLIQDAATGRGPAGVGANKGRDPTPLPVQ